MIHMKLQSSINWNNRKEEKNTRADNCPFSFRGY